MPDSTLLRYFVGRVLRVLLTVWGLVSLVFLLVRLVPGDPAAAILGDFAAPEELAELRYTLGLDQPIILQYGDFLQRIFAGTLGASFRYPTRTVWSMIREVLPSTIELATAAVVVSWVFAIGLGTVAAVFRGRLLDRLAVSFSLFGLMMPSIWLGPLLILVFSVHLRWAPLPGEGFDAADGVSRWQALVLPALTLGFSLAAILTRQTRGALSEILKRPFVLAARARGLSAVNVLFKHAWRNAAIPVITISAAQLGALLSGAVVVERIYDRPGLGDLFLEAFFARDIPVVQGTVLVIAVMYVLINFALDLTYALIDPRVRLT